MIIKYTINKHKGYYRDYYVVWKETKTEHGYGAKGIFQGTRKECQEYLEKLKKES